MFKSVDLVKRRASAVIGGLRVLCRLQTKTEIANVNASYIICGQVNPSVSTGIIAIISTTTIGVRVVPKSPVRR